MSEYATMKSITLKNSILTPQIIQAYRAGTLSMTDINNVQDPLKEIYANTYQYLDFPNTSTEAAKLIAATNKNRSLDQKKLQASKMVYFAPTDPRTMSW